MCCRYVWKDGLFDITWSEVSEPILVAGGGDGAVIIFDQTVADAPVAVLPGHTAEVCSQLSLSLSRTRSLCASCGRVGFQCALECHQAGAAGAEWVVGRHCSSGTVALSS